MHDEIIFYVTNSKSNRVLLVEYYLRITGVILTTRHDLLRMRMQDRWRPSVRKRSGGDGSRGLQLRSEAACGRPDPRPEGPRRRRRSSVGPDGRAGEGRRCGRAQYRPGIRRRVRAAWAAYSGNVAPRIRSSLRIRWS